MMVRLLKTPKMKMIFALLFIFITASTGLFYRFLFSLLFAVAVDMTLLKIRKIDYFFPSAGIISAIIINLLLAPNLSFFELLLTILIAIVSKHFLRINKKHILNPAAIGLFLGGLIFGHGVSWWAVSWQQLTFPFFTFLILLLPGYISCFKMRRFKIVASFLLIYNLYYLIFARTITLFDPTVLFFSLVMLSEPMTTPSNYKSQFLFGIFVSVITLLISFQASIFIPDPLIVALLVGNAVFFKWRENWLVLKLKKKV
ncbi:hypothetical protein A2768_01260 [Candidatus Roizmanbacteria bacterium RIFCSPHIGHO2_01_FULL_37_16]|nr:MAG: hypothetical protein A2768_01260 [Candidatus Roizmanbacteria bacterium RIFCSPHIGHO2_01_FULL_37_16]